MIIIIKLINPFIKRYYNVVSNHMFSSIIYFAIIAFVCENYVRLTEITLKRMGRGFAKILFLLTVLDLQLMKHVFKKLT